MRVWRVYRLRWFVLTLALGASFAPAFARQNSGRTAASVPVFTRSFRVAGRKYQYTVAGRDPELGGTTTIPTVLIPLNLDFNVAGKHVTLAASPAVPKVIASPIFQKAQFATGDTQYGDALQRAQFYTIAQAKNWHTLLGEPHVAPPVNISIPAADGYLLTSESSAKQFAIVDLNFVQKKLFEAFPRLRLNAKTLVIAVARDTDFYPIDDATVCCAWGAHGAHLEADSKTAQAFVLGSYLDPGVVPGYSDVQTLTAQLAQWLNDPLNGYRNNVFPAWRAPGQFFGCGGHGIGTFYRSALPTAHLGSAAATRLTLNGSAYHVANAALISWYSHSSHAKTFRGSYSFPNSAALTAPAEACERFAPKLFTPTASPLAETHGPNGHQLIGYWVGYRKSFPLRDVSPQWDVVIVAFAPPAKGSTSLMVFRTPGGYTTAGFKADIKYLQSKGKKVLLSLGGGGQVVTLNTVAETQEFVRSVGAIVTKYGFDGIDLDFETPSLILQPGDTDFRHPTTPSIVNLISAMRQLHQRFGPKFMLAEVPEGPQVPAGLVTYGGQFGSFLPVIYATRKYLSFVDVQNYNTPPLEGLDGNYYMPDTADYYVAMTEMMLRGFHVGRSANSFFPALPPQKVAIGFLAGRSPLPAIEASLRYLIQGTPSADEDYRLRDPAGYPAFDGAMYWNIQADRRENYGFSNAVGPLLHALPAIKRAR